MRYIYMYVYMQTTGSRAELNDYTMLLTEETQRLQQTVYMYSIHKEAVGKTQI